MNDDTNALVERARGLAGYKYQHHTIHVPAALNLLADTIERLERDRDALAERCEKLWHALRRYAIVERYCHCCGQICQDGYEVEWHAPGCLAAPKDAP